MTTNPNERAAKFMGVGWYPCHIEELAKREPYWPQVWAELERRGLLLQFCWKLCDVMGMDITCEAHKLITATPAQRLAALNRLLDELEDPTHA